MEITIDLNRDDYADFNKYVFLKKNLKKRIYVVAIVAIVMPLAMLKGDFDLVQYLVKVVLAAVVFGSIYLGGMFLALKRTGKLPSDNGSVLGKKKFVITDDGLVEETENNTNLQKWKSITSIETNKCSVFIFVDTIAAYVIPKRFFKDENEQNLFIAALNEKSGKAN